MLRGSGFRNAEKPCKSGDLNESSQNVQHQMYVWWRKWAETCWAVLYTVWCWVCHSRHVQFVFTSEQKSMMKRFCWTNHKMSCLFLKIFSWTFLCYLLLLFNVHSLSGLQGSSSYYVAFLNSQPSAPPLQQMYRSIPNNSQSKPVMSLLSQRLVLFLFSWPSSILASSPTGMLRSAHAGSCVQRVAMRPGMGCRTDTWRFSHTLTRGCSETKESDLFPRSRWVECEGSYWQKTERKPYYSAVNSCCEREQDCE